MKKAFILCLMVSVFISQAHGQDTISYFLNSQFKITKSPENAKYTRKVFQVFEYWCVRDYYLNGTLMMTGNFIDKELTRKHSIFRYYYESGRAKLIERYNDNQKDGKWTRFYENGQIDFVAEYVNNLKTGEWLWYFENGQLSAREKYVNDVRVKAKFWNEQGKKVEPAEAEYEPAFEGEGIEKFTTLITEKAEYPKKFANSQIHGVVKIRFTIDETGEITNIRVINTVHSWIDKIVLDQIKSAPKWTPGKLHNRFYPYEYDISVKMEYKPE